MCGGIQDIERAAISMPVENQTKGLKKKGGSIDRLRKPAGW